MKTISTVDGCDWMLTLGFDRSSGGGMFKTRSLILLVLALLVVSPALAQQSLVVPSAQATQAATSVATQPAVQGPTVGLGTSKDFPKILVGPTGLTLYTFITDTLNQTTC